MIYDERLTSHRKYDLYHCTGYQVYNKVEFLF